MQCIVWQTYRCVLTVKARDTLALRKLPNCHFRISRPTRGFYRLFFPFPFWPLTSKNNYVNFCLVDSFISVMHVVFLINTGLQTRECILKVIKSGMVQDMDILLLFCGINAYLYHAFRFRYITSARVYVIVWLQQLKWYFAYDPSSLVTAF